MVKYLNASNIETNQTTGHILNSKDCNVCEETSKIYSILEEIQDMQQETSSGCVTIKEEELTEIYDKFILPYIDCNINNIGSLNDIIRLRDSIKIELEKVKTDKSKYMLNILNDILTVIINARNDKIEIIKCNNQLAILNEKYNACKIEVINLKHKISDLTGESLQHGNARGYLGGSANIQVLKIKPLIYITALFNIVEAWYKYLYPGCGIDPDKYKLTQQYVASFCDHTEARNELYKLLDEKYKDDQGEWK
jgi:hypothetical protein